MKKFSLGLLAILISFAADLYSQENKNFEELSVSQFQSKLNSTPDAVLLDLRTNEEVSKGVILTARQIDFFERDFESIIDQLDKDKTYFLYCASGGRSGETIELMKDKGFNRVYNLTGGFMAWQKSKLPIELPKK